VSVAELADVLVAELVVGSVVQTAVGLGFEFPHIYIVHYHTPLLHRYGKYSQDRVDSHRMDFQHTPTLQNHSYHLHQVSDRNHRCFDIIVLGRGQYLPHNQCNHRIYKSAGKLVPPLAVQ